MIEKLIASNCIKIGKYTLKNGETSKYYFNLKNLIAYPSLLREIGDKLYQQLGDFDIICGVPYGGLPLATYISTTYNKPLIFFRNSVKEYGTQQMIEGEYKQTDRCVIIDDVITTGGSLQEAIDILENNVTIAKVAVIFDRQQNYSCSYPVQFLLNKNDVVKYRLHSIKNKKKTDICFSADLVEDLEKLLDIIDKIGSYIAICKIHYDTIDDRNENFKDALINLSIKHDFLIMEDRKVNDISYIVEKQYQKFNNWVDLVTVHSLVSDEVIQKLSGVLIVANMSNNSYDFSEKSIQLANNNSRHVIGFIAQERIKFQDFVTMTPGISFQKQTIDDQRYRAREEVDTDFIIVGRAIYNASEMDDVINDLKSHQCRQYEQENMTNLELDYLSQHENPENYNRISYGNFNTYDKVLAWTSIWTFYAAFLQNPDTIRSRLLQIATYLLGLFSYAHWRWYDYKPFLYLDGLLVIVVSVWHIIDMPNTNMLLCAFLSLSFFIATCVLKPRYLFITNGFKFRYFLLHNSFRFFGFWMVMLAHGNDWSLSISIMMWITALVIAYGDIEDYHLENEANTQENKSYWDWIGGGPFGT